MYRYTIKLEANISPLVPAIKKFENSISDFLTHMGYCETLKIRGNILDLMLTSEKSVTYKEKREIKKIVTDSFNIHLPEYNWSIKSFELEGFDCETSNN